MKPILYEKEVDIVNTELEIHALGQVHCTYYYNIFHDPPGAGGPPNKRG
jgi:hypothetical protein